MSITCGIGFFPMWQRGGFCFYENGGRMKGECLDMTINVWKFNFGLTIWGLSFRLPFPVAKNGHGYCVGWLPVGRAE